MQRQKRTVGEDVIFWNILCFSSVYKLCPEAGRVVFRYWTTCLTKDHKLLCVFTRRLGVKSLSSAAKITTFSVLQQERAWRTSPGVELSQNALVGTDCLTCDVFSFLADWSLFNMKLKKKDLIVFGSWISLVAISQPIRADSPRPPVTWTCDPWTCQLWGTHWSTPARRGSTWLEDLSTESAEVTADGQGNPHSVKVCGSSVSCSLSLNSKAMQRVSRIIVVSDSTVSLSPAHRKELCFPQAQCQDKPSSTLLSVNLWVLCQTWSLWLLELQWWAHKVPHNVKLFYLVF